MIWFQKYRSEHQHTLSSVLELFGVSKQALSKHKRIDAGRQERNVKIIDDAAKFRLKHKKMSCRKLYVLVAPESMGRDRCEALLLSAGFRVKPTPAFIKTTVSQTALVFPNLIEGLELTGINQVWQSDLTYYWNGRGFYYFVFVTDVYSRRIIGHSTCPTMHADGFVRALSMALRLRGEPRYGNQLIHHLDRGGQYVAHKYLKLQRDHEIQTSMCKNSWENAYVERVNGTIKGEYLFEPISALHQVRRQLNESVNLYNEERPHLSLPGRMAPSQFERMLPDLSNEEKPKFKIYKELENRSSAS
jgi:putative transposase